MYEYKNKSFRKCFFLFIVKNEERVYSLYLVKHKLHLQAPLCISIETVNVAFFFQSGVETLQVLGVEVSTGASTELNVRSL
jgi:hypothetical protein